MSRPSITEFVEDRALLGLSISPAQRTLLKSIYGLPLSAEQFDIYRACTGREAPPVAAYSEATIIAGARSGKDSRIAAPVAIYEALFGQHERHLGRGERGIVLLVAQDAKATKVAFTYIRDYLLGSPLLASRIDEVLAWEVVLTNKISVRCFPCTAKAPRGWSIPVGVMDEPAFFRLEGAADSDSEIQTAIRRGQVNFPDARLLKISTPYMKAGIVYEDFQRAYGQEDPDTLVWRAPSVLMNPSLRPERLEQMKRLDPIRFEREIEAEFLDDVSAWVPGAWIEDAVVTGRRELPPGPYTYFAAVDPSGGGGDAFTMSIVHQEGDGEDARVIQDVLKGWKRVGTTAPDLEAVVGEIAAIAEHYAVRAVVGDRYAGQWVRQAFERRHGITYVEAPEKSVAYLELEPWLAQGRIALLDHAQQTRELKLLERHARQGGRVVVDHPRSSHDDHANALAVAVWAAQTAEVPFTAVGADRDGTYWIDPETNLLYQSRRPVGLPS